MSAVGTKRIDTHDRHECRIDAAGKAEHYLVESRLLRIIFQRLHA